MEENTKNTSVADELISNKPEVVAEDANKVDAPKDVKNCDDCVFKEENESFERGLIIEPRKSKSYPKECAGCTVIQKNKRLHYDQYIRDIESSNSSSSPSLGGYLFLSVICILGFIFIYIYVWRPEVIKQDNEREVRKAYLALLEDNRNRHLEYEPLGTIVSSTGQTYYLYEKDDEYYVFDKDKYYHHNDYRNSEKSDKELEFQKILSEQGDEDFRQMMESRNTNSRSDDETLDKYKKLTPCSYYETTNSKSLGEHYNYCFYRGKAREYFNI